MNAIIFCLALNLFFEARDQPMDGKIGVTWVVINRVMSDDYPDKVCDVVYQAKRTKSGKIILHKCQFSWFCNGLSDVPRDRSAFLWSRHIAMLVVYGLVSDPTDGATHYHTTRIRPVWSKRFHQTTTIGDHIFYKRLGG